MTFKKYKSLFLLTLLSFFFFGFSLKTRMLSTDDILLRSRLAISTVRNLNYDCSFVQKFAGGNDTLKTKATIYMDLKSRDTLLGCDMKMTSQFTFYSIGLKTELFYNGKKNISLNHTKKKATIDTIGARGSGKPTVNLIKQNFPTADLINHYTEKKPYEPFFKKFTKITHLSDEKVGVYTCYKLEILSMEAGKKKVVQLFIDKETFLPVRRIDAININNKIQYSDFTLSAIKTNNPFIKSLMSAPSIPKDYEVDYFRLDRY